MDAEMYAAIDAYDVKAWALSRGAKHVKIGELLMRCPRCGKEKLAVNTDKRSWHCWYCQGRLGGNKGGLIALLALVDNRTRADVADDILRQAKSRPIGAMRQIRPQATKAGYAPALPIDWPPHWEKIDPDAYDALPYLRRRGITQEDVYQFGLVFCARGRYSGRLVFPVFERERLVYYQARAMWERGERQGDFIKSLNPPRSASNGTTSEDVLMNLDVARHYARVVVVEGPVDCVRAGPSAVATFGKKISARQIAKLRHAGVRSIDLFWDGPSETEPQGAHPEMRRAAPLLDSFFDLKLVFAPQGDPGSMSRHDIEALRAAALPHRRSP